MSVYRHPNMCSLGQLILNVLILNMLLLIDLPSDRLKMSYEFQFCDTIETGHRRCPKRVISLSVFPVYSPLQ